MLRARWSYARNHGVVEEWSPRLPVTQKIAGSIPVSAAILENAVHQR